MAADQKKKIQPQWKHALAGGTAGLAATLILHPLDVVKTRLQVQDGAGLLPAYRGTVDALRQIVRQEGWRALYSGLTPALAGSGLAWGIYFFAYNRAKERYQRSSGQSKLSPGWHLVSAAEAGAVVCFITNPIWVVKTRLQLQRKTVQQAAAAAAAAAAAGGPAQAAAAAAGQAAAAAAAGPASIPRLLGSAVAGAPAEACALEYRGFVHAFVQIARCEGLGGLYKGLLPSLLLVSHGAIQFAVYEELKHAAESSVSLQRFTGSLDRLLGAGSSGGSGGGHASGSSGKGSSGSDSSSSSSNSGGLRQHTKVRELTPAEITACGALSKLAASVATYPSQVLRARLQQRMDARTLQYTGVGDVIRKTLQREGLGGFYKGLVPNVLRVMPQSALTFLVYESVMRVLADRQQAQQAQQQG
ncbi:folate transporter chloroplastic isoform X1 [Chlorella sorokiniana]|uniref:Folate transporter chloroplastic isoform X1 n=1 Tax=Chlorella sorokiniana TaxID=3076 RepID=A0A2P6TB58_CHLSO|nr:folate transporter chloroplastic isoform X1 [Chlorella sorokiniana]|eukprot:PRW05777.1 folate transporter chloroplastic isoform X1 [Chlorella sorokiniana]